MLNQIKPKTFLAFSQPPHGEVSNSGPTVILKNLATPIYWLGLKTKITVGATECLHRKKSAILSFQIISILADYTWINRLFTLANHVRSRYNPNSFKRQPHHWGCGFVQQHLIQHPFNLILPPGDFDGRYLTDAAINFMPGMMDKTLFVRYAHRKDIAA